MRQQPDLQQRSRLISRFEERLARAPTELSVAHDLGALCFWSARHSADRQRAEESWKKVIGSWAMLLDERAWAAWAAKRSRVYGQAIAAEESEAARKEVVERLVGALADHDRGATPPADGLPLELLFHLEAQGVELLSRTAGLTPAADGKRLACGPMMVRALGLGGQLARLVRDLPAADEGLEDLSTLFNDLLPKAARRPSGLSTQDRRRLRQCFSDDLGPAVAWLEVGQAGKAIEALHRPKCEECSGSPRGARISAYQPDAPSPRVCAGHCPRFAERNPAHALLPDRGERLLDDALELTAETCMALAEEQVRREPPDGEAAAHSWRQALAAAAQVGAAPRFEERLAEIVVGRALALQHREDMDGAIALLEEVAAVTPQDHVSGKLAELLTDRGVKAGNDRRWDDAVADLRHAREINPHLARARKNLVTALRGAATERMRGNRGDDARPLLEEAVRVLQEALGTGEDDEETPGTLFELQLELAAAGAGPAGKVAADALELLTSLLDGAAPGESARPADSPAELDASQEEHGDALRSRRAADPGPAATLRTHLGATGLKFQRAGGDRYLLPFEADRRRDRLIVELQAEEDRAVIAAPMPPGAGDEALYGLLRATYDADIFKLCRRPTGRLALVADVPVRLLTANSMAGLIRQAAAMADMPQGKPAVPEALSLQFRALQSALNGGRRKQGRGFFKLFSRRHQDQEAARQLPALCRQGNVACQGTGRDRFFLTLAASELKVAALCRGEAVSFIAHTGGVRPKPGSTDFYRRMAGINAEMRVGKVALDPEDDPAFMYELPALDEAGFREMCERLEAYFVLYMPELGLLA